VAQITRDDALSLIATQDIGGIIQEASRGSAALQTFRTVRMSSAIARMPVLAALPTAGFVNEEPANENSPTDATKPTSRVAWDHKELIAEEIAVIVPIHENVFDDATFDIWGQVRPLIAEAFGAVLDAAVFFGVNKPSTWTDDALVPGAIAAGNNYLAGSGTTPNDDLAGDINGTLSLVEEDGFDVNVAYTGRFLRARLRGLRTADGQPIYLDNMRNDGAAGSVFGQDLFYVTNGAWDRSEAELLVGDRNKAVLGIRQDVTVKLLDQATVGGINLAERDMIGLRAKMRVAFAVAAPPNPEASEDPYPFAVLQPAGS
jgi:HK97 family phage major capsid protein